MLWLTKEENPGEFVTTSFCDERTRRIEQRIESMKTEVINAINEKTNPPIPWTAKATIIASFIASASAIIIAFLS